jgi:hypothetical protein
MGGGSAAPTALLTDPLTAEPLHEAVPMGLLAMFHDVQEYLLAALLGHQIAGRKTQWPRTRPDGGCGGFLVRGRRGEPFG